MTKAKLGWRDLADRRVALMVGLAFSTGLPYLLVLPTLALRLREAGVPVTYIGLFSWLGLAYSLKFLWAPIVDAVDVPVLAKRLGRRRAWLITCQVFTGVALLGLGMSDPAQGLLWTAVFTFLAAFGAATQDVVSDAWRIDAAPDERQGVMVAAYQLGYRTALLFAGAGALYIAEFASWRVSYAVMAALLGVGVIAALLSPPVDRAPDLPGVKRLDFDRAVKAPIADLWRRIGPMLPWVLLLMALYRVSDFLSGVMANPLYIDLGYSKTQIASIAKVYGIWISIVGAFAGGISVARLGLFRTMVVGAVLQAVSHLTFAWLSLQPPSIVALGIAISADNFSLAYGGTALVTYMSALTGAGFTATQYALFSSLYALPGKVIAGGSGFVVEAWGYATFFTMTAAILVPVTALLFWVRRSPASGLAPRAEAEDAEASQQVR
jgi:PAT family beta-lactamase induction signal transducer AmpG